MHLIFMLVKHIEHLLQNLQFEQQFISGKQSLKLK